MVPGVGSLDAKIAIVAEIPGRNEVEQGIPMVGPAGENLNECLRAADIARSECYITNVIKDADFDIAEYIDTKKVHVHISDIGQRYIDLLRDELARSRANVIVATGNTALYVLTGRLGIEKWRSSILESTLLPGRKVIPTIHPAVYTHEKLFAKPDLYLSRYLIIHDLRRAKRESQFPEIRLTERETLIKPSFPEAVVFLAECRKHCQHGNVLFYDIEIYRNELSCISFAISAQRAMSIPFIGPNGAYFTLEEEHGIMSIISELLSNAEYRKGGQNIIFDSHFLLSRYGIRTHNMEDTMLAQGILRPSFRRGKGLAFITAEWTDIPYYKDEGKLWLHGSGSWENGWIYNALDSIACADAFPKQYDVLVRKRNDRTYERVKRLIPPLTYMMARGIRVDRAGFASEHTRYSDEMEATRIILDTIMPGVNPDSPKQISEYFYGVKGIKPVTKRGKITTDVDALKHLTGKGHREASLILKYRGMGKLIRTYFDPKVIDDDDRIRCFYNPVGTGFGRISSSRNIFGGGLNLQNVPHSVRKHLRADDGYIIYEIDMSQIEARIVAYVGNIYQLIEVFESGRDVHRMTAALIFGKKYDEISDELGSCKLGDGRASERDWGKKANHCHTEDTEVLTRYGWVSIREAYETGCAIAEWNTRNYHITFAEPLDWFHTHYTGTMYEFSGRYVSQFVTPEHRIPGIQRGKESFVYGFADKVTMKENRNWPTSGIAQNTEMFHSVWMRLIVAFQADGNWNGNNIKWNLKNPSKIARLKMLLHILGEPYTERRHGEMTVIYVLARGMARDVIGTFLPHRTKVWPITLPNYNIDILRVIADEILRWDGNGKDYWTKYRENADIIQTVFHLCGWKSFVGYANTNGIYRVSRLTPHTRYPAIRKESYEVIDVPIYCPMTHTGAFMVRRNGCISVSMNSFNYGFGPNSFALKYEVSLREAKWIHRAYHAAYPGIAGSYWKYVESELRRTGGLTTLYGRFIPFLGKWGESMLQSAYSAIPQGSCGEHLNERGICFLYYSDDIRIQKAELLTQTHDSIAIQLPVSLSMRDHAYVISELKRSLETPFIFRNRIFSIPTDLTVNTTLDKSSGITVKQFPGDVESLTILLEGARNKLGK